MYKIIDKESDIVLVKMDIKTFKAIESDINEDINDYEFVFDKPIKAEKLINM